MKKISTLIICLLLASFVFAGLPALSSLAEPKIISAQEGSDRLADLLTVVATKVDEIPAIDGDFSDPAWEEARASDIGATTWKAVYTDDELAMYIRWADHDASINTRGTWNWDADTQGWWRTGWEEGTWESFDGLRHPEWFNISFDISTDVSETPMTETGCGSFCHEGADGTMHHQTSALGAYVDSWLILAKHGFGTPGRQDFGWLQGVTSVSQEGDVVFNLSDPMDPREIIDGNITFVGYGEDKLMVSPDDPGDFAGRDTPANMYCRNCHEQLGLPHDPLRVGLTYGDPGDLMYSENWDETHTAPLYIELSPENFIDCMTLTQAEIDAGEAVLVADLSEEEFAEAWGNYENLNGNVPHLILQEPTGDQADVRVAANWHNGYWTVELKRNLVTDSAEYDVQFDDLSKDYPFAVTLTAHTSLVGGLTNTGWTLRFEQ